MVISQCLSGFRASLDTWDNLYGRFVVASVNKKNCWRLCFRSSFIMSSSFTGWNLEQIVGRLTKREVMSCLPVGWIWASDVRTWRVLESAVLHLLDDMKVVIHKAACTKDLLVEERRSSRWKWKMEDRAWTRQSCHHIESKSLDVWKWYQ